MASLYDDILHFLYDHQQQERELYEQFESKHKREAIKASAEELFQKGLITRRFAGAGLNMSFHGGKKVKSKHIATPSNPKLFAQIKDAGIQRVEDQKRKDEELKLRLDPPPTRPHPINLRYLRLTAVVGILAILSTYALNPTFHAFINRQFSKPLVPPAIDLTKDDYGFKVDVITGAGREGHPENIPTFLLTVENKNSNAKEVNIRYALFRELIWDIGEGGIIRHVVRQSVTDSSKLEFKFDKWRVGKKEQRKVKLMSTFEEIHMYGFYVASIGQLVDETDTVRAVFTVHKFSRPHNQFGRYQLVETPVNEREINEVKGYMNRYMP